MKINFIVTHSFLRTAAKTDPFYSPIIKAIEAEPGLGWKIFVSHKGIACGYPAAKVDDFRSLEVCSVWFYRLCRLIAWRMPSWKIYQLFGRLARPFFARKFNADTVVTQAGQFADHMKELTALIERFEGCKTDELHKKYLEIRLRHFVSLTFNILIQDMPILESLCKFDKFVALAERNPFVWDSANGFSYSNTLHFHPFRFMRRHKIMRLPYLLIFRLYIYLSELRFGK